MAMTSSASAVLTHWQAGVFLSRSSLSIVRIHRIWILTAIQSGNFVIWLLQARYQFLNIWLQFALMVFVGLCGGAMYVNTFASLVGDVRIADTDRELAINFTAFAINGGITVSDSDCCMAMPLVLMYG